MVTEAAAPAPRTSPGSGAGAPDLAPAANARLIETLTIENLRGIRHVRLTGLGRVNLLTGRNNIGKSTVLEALRLAYSDYIPTTISQLQRDREAPFVESVGHETAEIDSSATALSTLYYGLPLLNDDWPPIGILVESADGVPRWTKIGVRWFVYEDWPSGRRLVSPQPSSTDSTGVSSLSPKEHAVQSDTLIPALEVHSGITVSRVPLAQLTRLDSGFLGVRNRLALGTDLRCVHTGPDTGRSSSNLVKLWDQIALSDLEEHVVEALRVIDPRIRKISMVARAGDNATRIAIAQIDEISRPVPLRTFGDGINRMFGIALSLVNAKGGLLLIDEFENGLHYSVQADVWRMIFKLAADLGIQVFATTHSWDAVEAFQQAAAESPAEGALVRLARWDGHTIATTFSETDLAVVTRERIEVR